MVAGYQTFFNHAGDDDLKKLITDIIENGIRPEGKGWLIPPPLHLNSADHC